MKNENRGGEAIRLTNRTAKGLREQAKRQQFVLRLSAVILTVLLAALSVILGMQRILWVPVMLLLAIGLDALLIMGARSRYIQLTGQAICTEAAARIMRGERAEQQRIMQAQRDMAGIRDDLRRASAGKFASEEEDEDFFGGTPTAAVSMPKPARAEPAQDETPPARRRRRQSRLQVISGEEAK